MTAAVLRGTYVDPAAGKVTLRSYAADWSASRTTDAKTREGNAVSLSRHILPALGDRELRALRPSVVQAWLSGLAVSPGYARVLRNTLSAILSAAVDDGLIARNPCRAGSVKPPRRDRRLVVPWSAERVLSVRSELPGRYRAMADVGAGAGLRQGEVFGLAVGDLDFPWRKGSVIHVRRQVRIIGGQLVFGPPKGGKERETPLAEEVALGLAAHLREHPAREVTLPWREPGGDLVTAQLVFTAPRGGAVNRTAFNDHAWRPALRAAGVEPGRANGFHALRHHFASVLLDAGVSVKALAEYLGHHDAGFTLATYCHLMPASEDRARGAVDAAFRGARSRSDGAQKERSATT